MNNLLKKLVQIFLLAFVFNFVWENLHSLLYAHYQNGPITEYVLIRASLFDAAFITLLGFLFLKISYLQKRQWLSAVIGVSFAIALEIYALETGRWAYKEIMPVVPLIKTGLTPTLQLGLLSYLTFKIVKLKSKNY